MVSYHLSTGRIKLLSGNEKIAKALGYAGLIPFIIFSFGSWFSLPYITDAIQILIAYAAIILTFMGAIHWGVAMSSSDEKRGRYFIASVIPALVAWLALLFPALFALAILLVGFILLIAYDLAVEKSQEFPDWYIPMRTKLTSIVTLCLAGALTSLAVI